MTGAILVYLSVAWQVTLTLDWMLGLDPHSQAALDEIDVSAESAPAYLLVMGLAWPLFIPYLLCLRLMK